MTWPVLTRARTLGPGVLIEYGVSQPVKRKNGSASGSAAFTIQVKKLRNSIT